MRRCVCWNAKQQERPARSDQEYHCEQQESPEAVESEDSLRASLTSFGAVLVSSAFPDSLAPFSPAQPGKPNRAGLKGAVRLANETK